MVGECRYYFPGANTPEGFVSYYGDILSQNEACRIFCIKGGPGTGKSTLMKDIGSYYLQKGINVEFLKCSSDPASLDGLLVNDKNIAIIDGTSPHITDPVNPGAVDEIINLAEHLDSDMLIEDKRKIIDLSRTISETFAQAYVYLKCTDAVYRRLNDIYKKYICEDKLYELIMSISLPDKRNKTGKKKRFFGSSITSSGLVNEFRSLTKEVRDIYLIEVPGGYKPSGIIDFLSGRIMNQGYDVEELYCPMKPNETAEHIISKEAGLALFTCNEYHGKDIFEPDKVRALIKADIMPITDTDKNMIEELKNVANENIGSAIKHLKIAKKKHDELENYYIKAMDFDAVNKIKEQIIKRINELTV